MRPAMQIVLALACAVMITFGVGLYSPPAGWIVGGIIGLIALYIDAYLHKPPTDGPR